MLVFVNCTNLAKKNKAEVMLPFFDVKFVNNTASTKQ